MKILVTGGGGFLGSAVCRLLAGRGDDVISLSRNPHNRLAGTGVRHVLGDIADITAVTAASAGCDAVIHTAAKAGVWGSYSSFYAPNVTGTENVIGACRRNGIGRLVMTSSPSVVFHGQDMEGADESVGYPETHDAPYPETKAMAERLVLVANGPDLATVALRPHLIWGPGDPHLVKRIVERGRSGKLKRIGKTPKRIDSIFIDNAADAHVLALDRLQPGVACAGKVYFISNDEPMDTWDLVNGILAAAGVSPVTQSIPVPVALAAAGTMEAIWKLLRIRREPLLTRFVVRELSTSHWFDISAAKRDLGYHPRVSIAEGLIRLKEFFGQAGERE